MIAKVLVPGLHAPEYKGKVVSILDMKAGCKNKPDYILHVMREVVVDWKKFE